jgi:hypothetical protein
MNHDKGQHFYLSSGLMIIHRVGRSFRSLFLRVQPSMTAIAQPLVPDLCGERLLCLPF